MKDHEIKMLQCRLAGAFSEVYDASGAWYPMKDVLETASCGDEKVKDIEKARKRLKIETVTINGLEYWRWSDAIAPDIIWGALSVE